MMVPAWVMLLLSMRAMPKSAIFTSRSCVSMMLAGLMSRCTTPRSWLYCSPASTPCITRTVSAGVRRSPASSSAFSDVPSTNSMTI